MWAEDKQRLDLQITDLPDMQDPGIRAEFLAPVILVSNSITPPHPMATLVAGIRVRVDTLVVATPGKEDTQVAIQQDRDSMDEVDIREVDTLDRADIHKAVPGKETTTAHNTFLNNKS